MNRYFWLGLLPLHVLFIFSLINYELISWGIVIIFWILLSGYGVGVTLHRMLSHRALDTYQPIKYLLSVISCLCIQGSPIFWVNVHRGYHHRYSDTEKDIHSPIHGKLWAYILWTCKIEAKDMNFKYVPDLLRSKFQLALNTYYFHIIISFWVLCWLISPSLLYSVVIAQMITLHAEFCVNLFCHTNLKYIGYRNFDTSDNSRNYWLFGLLCWGIGFHNNHHGKPNDYNFAHSKYEFDPTVILVKTIKVK